MSVDDAVTKIQKLIKNKKKIVQNMKTRMLFYTYLTQNRLSVTTRIQRMAKS